MYAWVWRHLPGPWPAKLAISVVTVAVIVAVLFTVVFPWLEPRLPFSNVTVDDASAAAVAAVAEGAPPAPALLPC
jgi:hypothetical protein